VANNVLAIFIVKALELLTLFGPVAMTFIFRLPMLLGLIAIPVKVRVVVLKVNHDGIALPLAWVAE
jgi:hypothetical protein